MTAARMLISADRARGPGMGLALVKRRLGPPLWPTPANPEI